MMAVLAEPAVVAHFKSGGAEKEKEKEKGMQAQPMALQSLAGQTNRRRIKLFYLYQLTTSILGFDQLSPYNF